MPLDRANDVILLTSASGKQCSQLIPLLYGKCKKLRLAVYSPASETRLRSQYPNAEVVRADITLTVDIQRILKSVTTVLHIGRSFHPREPEIGFLMIDAACKEARNGGAFKHFV